MKNANKLSMVGSAIALAFAMMTADAQAAVITFTFNCIATSSTVCGTPGNYGTLTLSDSSSDTNRVDLALTLNGSNPNGTLVGIDKFFLNYDGSVPLTLPLPGKQFRMVPVSTSAGDNGTSFVTLSGPVAFSSNSLGPPGTSNSLDMSLDPTSNAITTFTASLLLRTIASGGINTTEFDLDASMFNLTSPTSGLYAGVETVPIGDSLNAGATLAVGPEAVPEPSSLLLLATALFGLALRRRPRS